jgi:hypothetical protein
MQNTIDTFWEVAEFEAEQPVNGKPQLDLWSWSFAYLPDARMKAVAAGWMVRVLLGGDPAEISEEEVRALSVGALLATGRRSASAGSWQWDA